MLQLNKCFGWSEMCKELYAIQKIENVKVNIL